MTGADSPVIAASLTAAMPSITSPSPGMTSPAATITTSSRRSCAAGTSFVSPVGRINLACVSVRVLRRLSACALPRPSAIASAKFANSTVNHSHSAIWNSNPASTILCASVSRISVNITSTLVTSTTNITGFLIIRRGSSLVNDSIDARETISRFQSAGALRSLMLETPNLEQFSGRHQQLLDDRSERDRAEEGQRANDHDYADQQEHERDTVGRERAGAGGGGFLGRD